MEVGDSYVIEATILIFAWVWGKLQKEYRGYSDQDLGPEQ